MRGIALLVFGLLFIAVSGVSAAIQEPITPEQAGKVDNGWTTVCGKVAQVAHISEMANDPTFIYLDKPFPHQVFEIVIWGDVRRTFSHPPEALYTGKKVCVAGVDRKFQGIPEIVVGNESQITVMRETE
jgi:hypothetical protein